MIVNQEKMRAVYGNDDERIEYSENDVIRLIKERVEWLTSHNKNYTQAQWVRLLDIEDMLDAIEVL